MTQPLTFVVLSTDLDNFKAIRSALTAEAGAQLLAGGNDTEQLYEEIVRLKPSAAIIALSEKSDAALRFIERLASECPQVALISAAHNNSPDVILQSLRAGAREFLRLPISADELRTVMARVATFCANQVQKPKAKGKMVSVFSSKGGCGTTFVATNLAASAAPRTVLVDLNLQAGDLPLFLGVEPKYSIADMVENRSQLDESLMASFVTPYSSHLSLLAAPRQADSADEIEPQHVFTVLQRLREVYEYVVIDPQHTFDSITLAALDQSDEIVLVLTVDIPALRSTQRALEIFDRLGYPRKKIRIVVNRWSKQIDLDLREVEKFLGEPVIGFIPSDYQVAVSSINLGQPLVLSQPNSKIAQEIRGISERIAVGVAPIAESQARKTLWGSLFNKERSQSRINFSTSLEKV